MRLACLTVTRSPFLYCCQAARYVKLLSAWIRRHAGFRTWLLGKFYA